MLSTLSVDNGGESAQDHSLTRVYISHPRILSISCVFALLHVGLSVVGAGRVGAVV